MGYALVFAEQTAKKSKKLKVDAESGSRSDEPVPIVVLSESLANFFGTGEREMSQAEVIRRVWEYVKVNQLEVGTHINNFANSLEMEIYKFTCYNYIDYEKFIPVLLVCVSCFQNNTHKLYFMTFSRHS